MFCEVDWRQRARGAPYPTALNNRFSLVFLYPYLTLIIEDLPISPICAFCIVRPHGADIGAPAFLHGFLSEV